MKQGHKIVFLICGFVFLLSGTMFIFSLCNRYREKNEIENQVEYLKSLKSSAGQMEYSDPNDNVMLPEYAKLYELNSDIIGWLYIEDTKIDYPVMQTMSDEDYYLYLDFYGKKNQNGTLIMDTDSIVGVGTAQHQYMNGIEPSTNLIIHGHSMKTGMMFGELDRYREESYGKEHNTICFDSLYEKREYELIAVFYSQIDSDADSFKYYNFFQANNQEEFDAWYQYIKELSIYDTGVTAEFGDEFITLNCCAYHVEDGRFVVVGKRTE